MTLVGTSWKMTKTLADARQWCAGVTGVQIPSGVRPFVVPPFTALATVADLLRDSGVRVGSQNAHWADPGAWTGEVSMAQIRDAGATFVELGHSERREHFGETDDVVNRKVRAAVDAGLVPLLCVGETAERRADGAAIDLVCAQVRSALAGLTPDQVSTGWVAYEPVWAIGSSGTAATPDDVAPVMAAVAEVLAELATDAPPLLYGGSVTRDNAAELLAVPAADGLFVGRGAWQAPDFAALLQIAATAA